MLASKKQDWAITAPAPQVEVKRKSARILGLDVELRKKCCSLAILLLLLAGIATLQSERIISTGYQYVKLQAELKAVERENEKLRVEIAKLKSLDRIQSIAVNSLGMTSPKHVFETRQINDSGKMAYDEGQVISRRKL